ncbi:hypothetical protein THIOKS190110 [Thiocapsa sp. KS1]|nr:hypothetical protein THIOKS190110 [Thiocapsa sp. KS1]
MTNLRLASSVMGCRRCGRILRPGPADGGGPSTSPEPHRSADPERGLSRAHAKSLQIESVRKGDSRPASVRLRGRRCLWHNRGAFDQLANDVATLGGVADPLQTRLRRDGAALLADLPDRGRDECVDLPWIRDQTLLLRRLDSQTGPGLGSDDHAARSTYAEAEPECEDTADDAADKEEDEGEDGCLHGRLSGLILGMSKRLGRLAPACAPLPNALAARERDLAQGSELPGQSFGVDAAGESDLAFLGMYGRERKTSALDVQVDKLRACRQAVGELDQRHIAQLAVLHMGQDEDLGPDQLPLLHRRLHVGVDALNLGLGGNDRPDQGADEDEVQTGVAKRHGDVLLWLARSGGNRPGGRASVADKACVDKSIKDPYEYVRPMFVLSTITKRTSDRSTLVGRHAAVDHDRRRRRR